VHVGWVPMRDRRVLGRRLWLGDGAPAIRSWSLCLSN